MRVRVYAHLVFSDDYTPRLLEEKFSLSDSALCIPMESFKPLHYAVVFPNPQSVHTGQSGLFIHTDIP